MVKNRNKKQTVAGEKLATSNDYHNQAYREDKAAHCPAQSDRSHGAGNNLTSHGSECNERACKNSKDKVLKERLVYLCRTHQGIKFDNL